MSQPIDPLNSGIWFRTRMPVNFGIAAVHCAILIVILSLVMPMVAADAIAFALTLCLYFFVLRKRSFSVICEHCRCHISSTTPWVCGSCKGENTNTEEYPFIHKCRACSVPPKAYKCHHVNCGQLIFLSEDRQEDNFAYCLNSASAFDPKARQSKRREQREEIQESIDIEEAQTKLDKLKFEREHTLAQKRKLDELQHAKIVAELDSQLAMIERQQKRSRMRPLEKQRESLNEEWEDIMAIDQVAAEKLADVEERFKSNPDALEKAKMAIEHWVDRHRK